MDPLVSGRGLWKKPGLRKSQLAGLASSAEPPTPGLCSILDCLLGGKLLTWAQVGWGFVSLGRGFSIGGGGRSHPG